jgi:hypothetical protein
VNNVASRGASLALLLLGVMIVTVGPAAARRAPKTAPTAAPAPTATPIYFPMTPPTPIPGVTPASVATPQPALMAAAGCQNDQLLAFRAVPMPTSANVTVCGRIIAPPSGSGALLVSVDGSQPIPVSGASGANVHPGDTVLVRGRYHRDKTGAEGIDVANAGAVSLLGPAQATP